MDPLSVIASCIAVGTLVWQTGEAIADLRTITGELPQRLCAVKNEVNDIGLVISQVQELAERRKYFQSLVFEAADCNVMDLLEKAQIDLTTLQIIVSGLAKSCSKEGNRVAFFRAHAWKQKQAEIERVQKEVTSIKSSLMIVLQASNAYVSFPPFLLLLLLPPPPLLPPKARPASSINGQVDRVADTGWGGMGNERRDLIVPILLVLGCWKRCWTAGLSERLIHSCVLKFCVSGAWQGRAGSEFSALGGGWGGWRWSLESPLLCCRNTLLTPLVPLLGAIPWTSASTFKA